MAVPIRGIQSQLRLPSNRELSWVVPMEMKILDADRVAECLEYKTLIEALRSGLTGTGSSPSRMRLETGYASERKLLLVKPAWDEDAAIIKLLTLNEMNRETELPFIQGVIVVLTRPQGLPFALWTRGSLLVGVPRPLPRWRRTTWRFRTRKS